MIYLDNAATTFPKPEEVYRAMDKANRELAVNAGRGSYKKAQDVSKIIDETKQLLRGLVHTDIETPVVFSPSITIALNQVIRGYDWPDNAVVYVSPFEHNAVARTLHSLVGEKGVQVEFFPINEKTLEVDLEKLQYQFMKKHPDAIICTHVSNVTGYILPVSEIFSEGKKYNSFTVLDTAQSLGLIEVDTRILNADIIAFAGHKTLYGPLGIGGFINVSCIPLNVEITGGTGSDSLNLNMPAGFEVKYEPASANIIAIAGLNAALKVLDREKNYLDEKILSDYLISRLKLIDGITLYLPAHLEKHIGVVSMTIDSCSSDTVGMILDEDHDIAVRTGYHCAPWIHDYLNDKRCNGTVRVGIGKYNTKEDLDRLVEELKNLAWEF